MAEHTFHISSAVNTLSTPRSGPHETLLSGALCYESVSDRFFQGGPVVGGRWRSSYRPFTGPGVASRLSGHLDHHYLPCQLAHMRNATMTRPRGLQSKPLVPPKSLVLLVTADTLEAFFVTLYYAALAQVALEF